MSVMVNGELVPDQQFIEAYERLRGLNPLVGEGHEAYVLRELAEREVVEHVLLRQMAVKSGLTVSRHEVEVTCVERVGGLNIFQWSESARQRIADDLLTAKYIDWLGRHEPRPSRLQVERYYSINRAEFQRAEQVEVEHIVCASETPTEITRAQETMQRAEDELAYGQSFALVASKYSDCGQRSNLGWVQRGTTVEQFEKVVFSLDEGERSGVFRTIFGLHIAKVLRRKPPGFDPLEEVRPILSRRMLAQRRKQVVDSVVAQALRSATIEITGT